MHSRISKSTLPKDLSLLIYPPKPFIHKYYHFLMQKSMIIANKKRLSKERRFFC
jgi:hypothetical protein